MSAAITYTCHGAARQVTGSCHLLTCRGRRILVDCGMFQGGREEDLANYQPFGFDPSTIDVLLLTHAHLDHCGRIPKLVRDGFRGRILATAATRDLARLVLLDAASLQEEDAEREQRGQARRGGGDGRPLYTLDDALDSFNHFGEAVAYDTPVEVVPGVSATFLDAGHILGSAAILLEIGGTPPLRILFSGDQGEPGRPILRDPRPAPPADYVVMESTYGDRAHRPLPDSVDELYRAIREAFDAGGNVIVPTFALERAQEILYYLHRGIRDGKLPAHTPVFLDSPMAISATRIFRRHPECFGEAFREELEQGDPFAMPNLHFSRDTRASMAINTISGGAVILAGSGMCTGGRVRHHLKHNLWREQCAVVFVGYAADGTLARRIIDGASSVRIFGEDIRVRARIWTINGFSAHAGQQQLLHWLGDAPRREVLLVHGEYGRGMQALQACLQERGIAARMPLANESIELAGATEPVAG